MKLLASSWIPPTVAIAAWIMIGTQPLHAEVIEMTKKVAGATVHYKVVLPNGYDPGRAYPGILALGGGPQTMNTVDGILMRNFRAEAERSSRRFRRCARSCTWASWTNTGGTAN